MNIHVTLPPPHFSKKSPRLKLLIKGEEALGQKNSFIHLLLVQNMNGFLLSKLNLILLLGNAAANKTRASPIYSCRKSAYYNHIMKD